MEKHQELDNLIKVNNNSEEPNEAVEINKKISNNNNSHQYRGIILSLLSAFFLSVSNVFIKKAQLFSGTEQAAVRYTLQALIMISIAYYKGLNIFGEKNLRGMLLWRGLFGMFGLTFLHIAVKLINPSDAIAIFQTKVIIVLIFARFTLNERFSFVHILAVLMTVIGIEKINYNSGHQEN